MIELSDSSYYTGIAKDVEKRMKVHREGKGSKYVRSRLPIKRLVYCERVENRSEAQKRECAIKKLSRKKKEDLKKQFYMKIFDRYI